MKSFNVMLSICLFAGVVSADIAVNFANDSTPVAGAGSGGTVDVDEVLAQLIWTATTPSAQAQGGAALGNGEHLLTNVTAAAGFWGTFAAGVDTYLDSDVGGADINTGYLFVRLFDDSAKAEDDWYLQFTIAGPSLTEYDTAPDPPPAPYLTANLMPGGSVLDLDDATYGNQVIPEPAVASLIVIFGGGMLAGRRWFMKS